MKIKYNTHWINTGLDLEPIIFKLCDPVYGKGWLLEKAQRVEQEYRRWLFLQTQNIEHSLVPTEDMDEMWHVHILDTKKYAADCDMMFGEFLHHFPYFGMRGAEDKKHLDAAFAQTKTVFRDAFGMSYGAYGIGSAMCDGGVCTEVSNGREYGISDEVSRKAALCSNCDSDLDSHECDAKKAAAIRPRIADLPVEVAA